MDFFNDIFHNLALLEFYFLNIIYILLYIDFILSIFFQHSNILTRASHHWCLASNIVLVFVMGSRYSDRLYLYWNGSLDSDNNRHTEHVLGRVWHMPLKDSIKIQLVQRFRNTHRLSGARGGGGYKFSTNTKIFKFRVLQPGPWVQKEDIQEASHEAIQHS